MNKIPRINNQIKAPSLQVINDKGENLGVMKLEKALEKATEAELDLIEISPNANPPVARIIDYGKYTYQVEKKVRDSKKKSRSMEIKGIRINIGTSQHDLELKAKKAGEFLKEGSRVRIELFLKGRAKYLDKSFLNERLERLLPLIPEEHKIVLGPKKGHRGISAIIEKK